MQQVAMRRVAVTFSRQVEETYVVDVPDDGDVVNVADRAKVAATKRRDAGEAPDGEQSWAPGVSCEFVY